MRIDPVTVGFIFMIFILSMLSFMIYLGSYVGDDAFCQRNGYDYSPYYGSYTNYKDKDYGKLTCKAEYVEGDEHKSFNVTYNNLGIFSLYDDALVSQEVVGGKDGR